MDKIVLNDKIIEGLDVENPLDITTIMIEDTVEEIADNAFENLYNLHSIFISDNSNLRRIGKKAFSESGISNCRLSSSLEEIDEEAFADSTSLRFIIIPSGVKVSNDAFSGTDTEVIQIEKDKIIDTNSIIPNNVPDSIENKENVITINQEGKILSVPVRDDSFYIASHEFGVEYIAAKYLNTFIEDKPMNWTLSNSLATIFMVDSYQDIFDILGFPNNLSANQIRVIKDILETHKENQLFGVLEIIDGHVRRSCDEEDRTTKEFLENFDSIVSNDCYINYLDNIKQEHKESKK